MKVTDLRDGLGLLAEARARAAELEARLQALVELASPTSDPVATTGACALAAAPFEAIGFVGGLVGGCAEGRGATRNSLAKSAQRLPAENHLVLQRSGEGHGGDHRPRVLFLGHVDTVHEHASGFAGYILDGPFARGPGVADAKGGVVVMQAALELLHDVGALDLIDARVVLTSDEEEGAATSHELLAEAARGLDLCLGFEPARPDGSIVRARRGLGRFKVTALGRAAHAGQAHHEGRSAIHALALAVPRIEAMTDYASGVTVSVGRIAGGTRTNVVPERADLWIDARADDDTGARRIRDALFALDGWSPLAGTELRVRGDFSCAPWPANPETEGLVALWQSASEALGLGPLAAVASGGASDANQIYALSIPTLDGLGAVGGDYHSPREWVARASLAERAALTATALVAWVSARGLSARDPDLHATKETIDALDP